MVTLTDGKKKTHIHAVEWYHDIATVMTKTVIPTGMFLLNQEGDYIVDDIDEYIRRAVEWLDEDRTVNRMIIISNHEEAKNA